MADARVADFDLNVRIEEDDNIGIDLNLPLDEFGAVDFGYVQNLARHVVEAPIQVKHRRKEMSEELRKVVYQVLLAKSKDGVLEKKHSRIVADHFGLHIQSVQRLWKRGKDQLAHNIPVVVASKKGVNVDVRQSLLIWNNCATFLSSKE
ncbi:hypothetical protein OsJ_21287 [Oryza sativa Japonica Group]|uniref:DUF7769 domain-containing protein n=1 Tax=Oryza sativa subsp. japonica TaxID=39947 RepID=A3BBL3_ORYSJ|nr:hypothetical protein OsJ_21287 [Oryza sativa Japonica Group]